MALTLEKIESLAPDQASLTAARKLLKAGVWPTLCAAEGLLWGECQGSGATPYRVVVAEADAGYKCSCPSRKFPCKHALALMWLRAEGKVDFADGSSPEWVKDWLSRRRGSAGAKTPSEDRDGPAPSMDLAVADENKVPDEKAQARAEAIRERSRAEREAAIVAGLADLDIWMQDQVERGIAGFVTQSAKQCRVIAQRLVDAKAAALAARVDRIGAMLFRLPDEARPQAAIRELGQVHLIAEAYRRQDELPDALLADVRQAVGWLTTREALLTDVAAMRVEATWRVAGVLTEVQPDRLRRIETWLWRESDAGAGGELPQAAVLMDFVPVATGAETSGFSAGDRIAAELVFYPSVLPLRAQIVRMTGDTQTSKEDIALPERSLAESFEHYRTALAALPWLGGWPLTFHDAEVRRAGEALYLVDGEDGLALPLHASQVLHALPLADAGRVQGFGIWDGYEYMMCWANTALGRWVSA